MVVTKTSNTNPSVKAPPKKTLLPYKASDYRLTEELNPVQDMGKSGYADRSGKIVIAFKYSFAAKFINGFANVEQLIIDCKILV